MYEETRHDAHALLSSLEEKIEMFKNDLNQLSMAAEDIQATVGSNLENPGKLRPENRAALENAKATLDFFDDRLNQWTAVEPDHDILDDGEEELKPYPFEVETL